MPEGEEAAPPLTRTMSIVRWVLLGTITGFAVVMLLGWLGLNPLATSDAAATQYHCPMHPTYIASQPGDCPICGMSLVPIKTNAAADTMKADTSMPMDPAGTDMSKAKPGQYTCPMHPEVISDTPGKCPKCGMFLEQVPEVSKAKPGQYTCPMCPEIVSDTAGDCPKCGMPLEQVPPDTTSHAGHDMSDMGAMAEPAPVQGLVTITLDPKRLQLIGIKTGAIERRSLDGALKLTGYVTPDESKITDVHVRVSGWVKKLYVNETGEQMFSGAPLMTLYSQDLYQAQQDLILAAQSTQRAGDKSLTELRSQLLSAARQRLSLLGLSDAEISAIESSGKPMPELTLKSPVTGVVMQKSVVEGQFVGPDQTLFTIADLRRVWVLADVYEKDLGAVKVGTPVTLSVTSGEKISGKVSFVYPTISAETRTAKVRLEFDNPGLALRPGMYADVSVATGAGSTLAVPLDAVMDGGESKYVFVVHNGVQFEPRKVTVGRSSDEWYEVLGGLNQGETVVTSANFLIDSESRLQAAITGMGGTQTESHTGHTR